MHGLSGGTSNRRQACGQSCRQAGSRMQAHRQASRKQASRQGDMKWRYRAIHASIILFNIVCLQWMNWFVSHDHCASLRSFDDYFKLDYITLQNGYDDGACHGCDLSWGCSDGNNGGVTWCVNDHVVSILRDGSRAAASIWFEMWVSWIQVKNVQYWWKKITFLKDILWWLF